MSTGQTWGIDELEGELRHVRHVLFTGPDGEQIRARMVFDYSKPGTLFYNSSCVHSLMLQRVLSLSKDIYPGFVIHAFP